MAELKEAQFADLLDDSVETWITRNGREILIRDMTDSHLLNAIKYLQQRAHRYKALYVLTAMKAADVHHGEGAADAIDSELDAAMEITAEDALAQCVPAYESLCTEADRRKLEVPGLDHEAADEAADRIVLADVAAQADKEFGGMKRKKRW